LYVVKLVYIVKFTIEDVVHLGVFEDVALFFLQPLLSLRFVMQYFLLLLSPGLHAMFRLVLVILLGDGLRTLFGRLSFA
jgi:hypothetical protein